MIETYAIAVGGLIVVGAVLGILLIRALGARSQRTHRVATNHFDTITVRPRAVRSARVVTTYTGSPRVAISRQPELTLARRAAAARS